MEVKFERTVSRQEGQELKDNDGEAPMLGMERKAIETELPKGRLNEAP